VRCKFENRAAIVRIAIALAATDVRGAVEIAGIVKDEIGLRPAAVLLAETAVEDMQHSLGALWRQLEQYSDAVRAAVVRGAVNIALLVQNHPGLRIGAVVAIIGEGMKNRFFPVGRNFENRAVVIGAAIERGAVEIAGIIADNAAIRQTAILSGREPG